MTDIITMPDELYRTTTVRFNPLHVNTANGGSAFNPFRQVTGPSAVYWQVEMIFSISDMDTYRAFRRFVMKLRGGKVLARLYDPQATTAFQTSQPLGAGGATSTINVKTAAAAGAESLTVKNLTASQATALKYGDQLGIGENLYMVEDDASSDSNGWSTLAIQPPLRMAVSEGDAINLVKPTGLFRLVSGGDALGTNIDKLGEAFSLNFIEEPMFA
jgi:hypothetical protein